MLPKKQFKLLSEDASRWKKSPASEDDLLTRYKIASKTPETHARFFEDLLKKEFSPSEVALFGKVSDDILGYANSRESADRKALSASCRYYLRLSPHCSKFITDDFAEKIFGFFVGRTAENDEQALDSLVNVIEAISLHARHTVSREFIRRIGEPSLNSNSVRSRAARLVAFGQKGEDIWDAFDEASKSPQTLKTFLVNLEQGYIEETQVDNRKHDGEKRRNISRIDLDTDNKFAVQEILFKGLTDLVVHTAATDGEVAYHACRALGPFVDGVAYPILSFRVDSDLVNGFQKALRECRHEEAREQMAHRLFQFYGGDSSWACPKELVDQGTVENMLDIATTDSNETVRFFAASILDIVATRHWCSKMQRFAAGKYEQYAKTLRPGEKKGNSSEASVFNF